jgi:Leucine-rich repeat (LRR) protein
MTVQVLNLSDNKIIELEGRIFISLGNLVHLIASNNEIKYMSSKISCC